MAIDLQHVLNSSSTLRIVSSLAQSLPPPVGYRIAYALADQIARRRDSALVRALPSQAWTNRGTSNGHPISTRALLYIVLGHADHHLNVLHTRYGVPTI